MILRALAIFLAAAASSAAASDFSLSLPIACTLGETCHIQNYVDHDPTPAASDYTCGGLTYNGHDGTDFALPSLAAMQAGVDVLAAAPGIVAAIRNDMPDTGLTPETEALIEGRDCGNGVLIRHPGGWDTQYCHMKQGSVLVTPGQSVAAGDVLGEVGLSGRTQFPHAHLALRRAGQPVDPFAPDGQVTCGAPSAETLWQVPPAYTPGALLSAGFASAVPEYSDVTAGLASPETMPATAPALVLWGLAYGARAGDVLRLTIDGPTGPVHDHSAVLARAQAQVYRAAGRQLRDSAWPPGRYTGTVTLIRDGAVISRMQASTQID